MQLLCVVCLLCTDSPSAVASPLTLCGVALNSFYFSFKITAFALKGIKMQMNERTATIRSPQDQFFVYFSCVSLTEINANKSQASDFTSL